MKFLWNQFDPPLEGVTLRMGANVCGLSLQRQRPTHLVLDYADMRELLNYIAEGRVEYLHTLTIALKRTT